MLQAATKRKDKTQLSKAMSRSASVEASNASMLEVNHDESFYIQRKSACSCGGACPRCQKNSMTGVAVSEPNDSVESEADRVAEQVVSGSDKVLPKQHGMLATLQDKPDVASIFPGLAGTGKTMPASVNEYYSGKLGHDFGHVRIYTGVKAETAASNIQARAFTYGNDVVFNRNEYRPGSREGRRLLAHELVHVVQQNNTIGRVIQRTPQVVDCESRARTNILQAEQTAIRWINMASQRLSSPSNISPELAFHFQVSPDQADVLSSISSIFVDVKDHIQREEFTYTCVPQSDSRCEDEIIGTISGFAYLDTRSIYFCGDVTASGESNLTRLLIHEAIHAKIGGLDDGPYISDPLYPGNDPLSNTDAYASFIGDIATSPVFGLPQALQDESAGNIPGSGYGSSGYPHQSRETELAGFPVNSAALSQEAREYLDIFLEEWFDEFGITPVIVRLAGHADRAESSEQLAAVSRARAVEVADYLMNNLERFGLFLPENVLIESFSATRLFTGSQTAIGRALNRRVSIEIVRAP